MEKKIAVLGGDLRQVHLAAKLSAPGTKVYGMFMSEAPGMSSEIITTNNIEEILPGCQMIVLPLPVTVDGITINAPYAKDKLSIERCIKAISPETLTFAGLMTDSLRKLAAEKGLEIIDYFAREELTVLNAIPTAEGAIEIAMRELPITIFGSHVLVTGFGRIGKVIVRLLTAFGAKVWVAARRYSDHAWIRINGCEPIHTHQLLEYAGRMDVIINTVPALLFNREILSQLKKDCLVIDLASKPGGLDFEAASELGVKTIWALSMPGKVAPITAGEIIYMTLQNCLKERGIV